MAETANLQLPYLAAAQAQKHVTVNEVLLRLDALVQCAVVSATTTAEPVSPSDGQVYILPAGKTGAHWGAMSTYALAYYRDGVWEQITPREGFIAWAKDTDVLHQFDGAAWVLFSVADNAITNAKLRDSAALSVIGRGANSTGDPADIAAGTDGHVLRRGGTALGFGTLAATAFADGTIAVARASLTATQRLVGRVTSGAGNGEEVTASQVFDWLGATNGYVPYRSGGAWTANTPDNAGLIDKASAQTIGGVKTYSGGGERVTLTGSGGFVGIGIENTTPSVKWLVVTDSVGGMTWQKNGSDFVYFHRGAAGIFPASDNAVQLGGGSNRFSTLYAATGAINTSDEREKTPLAPLPEALKRAARRIAGQVGVFKRRDAISQKGDGARKHIGVTTQMVASAFAAEGLDPAHYALFCADPWTEEAEGTPRQRKDPKTGAPMARLGLRPDQLLWLLCAVQAEALVSRG